MLVRAAAVRIVSITAIVIALAWTGPAGSAHAQTVTVAGVTPGALAVDQSGQANYSVPIDVPPGIAGMEPSLSLNYSSGAGNGIAGMGWSIGGLSAITRCPRTPAQDGQWGGIEYNDNNRFCLDGKRLVAVSGVYGADGTEYRTEIDGFFKVVSYGKVAGSTGVQGNSPMLFRVWTKTGQIMDYGATADSRIEAVFTPVPAPETPPEVRAWAVSHIADTVGNYMIFGYFEDSLSGAHRLERIDYTYNDAAAVAAQSSVQFVYEARPDIASGYPGNALITSDVRLSGIQTHTDGALVRDYRLAYETGAATGRSRLLSVTECDGVGGAKNCLAPTSFAWKPENAGFTSAAGYVLPAEVGSLSEGAFVDVNGDGLQDFVRAYNGLRKTWLNTGSGWAESGPEYVAPFDITEAGKLQGRFIDVNGDGLEDFIVALSTNQTTWLNTGAGWHNSIEYKPIYISDQHVVHLWCQDIRENICDDPVSHHHVYGDYIDINGDGLVDFVQSYRDYNSILQATWLNTGAGWVQSAAYQAPFLIGESGRASVSECDKQNDCTALYRVDWDRRNGDFVDVNEDGLSDFVQAVKISDKTPSKYKASIPTGIILNTWLNTGSGWIENVQYKPLGPSRDFSIERIQTYCDKDRNCNHDFINRLYRLTDFIDVNGDGLIDHIEAHETTRNAWLNTGYGWLQDVAYNTPFPLWINGLKILTRSTAEAVARREGGLVDANGDGLVDYVRAQKSGATYLQTTWLSTGQGWLDGGPAFNPPFAAFSGDLALGDFADVDGDALEDFVEHVVGDNGVRDTWLLNSAAPDQLLSVIDSLGAVTALSYLPLTEKIAPVYEKFTDAVFPVQDIQAPLYVVSEVVQEDGAGGQAVTRYSYAGARADLTGRGFLGFRFMDATDLQTGIMTTTRYAQAFPYIGQIEATETYIPDPTGLTGGTTLARTANTLAEKPLNLGATVFPYVSQSVAESFEFAHGNDNLPVTTTTTASTYDDYGNPTQITVATAGGGETFTTDTVSIYSNDTVNWFLGRLTRATVNNTLPDARSAIRVSSFAYDLVTGLLNQEVVEPDIPALKLTTDYGHDVFGHRTGATVSGADIATRTTTIEYASAAPNYGRFATTATNALGHSETRTYDARFGAAASLTGPNGITTNWVYDGFGRKTLEARADSTETRWSYDLCVAQCPAGAVYEAAVQSFVSATGVPAGARAVSYFERLNRVFRSETEGFDGTPVFTDTVFDALGRVEKASRPYFDGALPGEIQWSVNTYDGIGRPKTVTTPDGGVASVAYDGLTTTETNPLGQVRASVNNAIGQAVQVTDNIGTRVINGYDPGGNLERTEVLAIDATSVVTTISWDIRGRKISMDDPDMGVWTYAYNALGELVSQTDAKLQTVTMTYDVLGRMTTRTEAEGATTFEYDNPAKTAAIGKPDRVSRTQDDYVEDYVYDALGRPAETAVTYEARDYVTTTTYDAAGRPDTLTYPAASGGTRFAVENTYNSLGYLDSVREFGGAGTVYWQAIAVDAEGRVTEDSLGNGLTELRDFDAATGLVQNIRVYDGLAAIKDQGYAFDYLGNFESRIDRLGEREETFAYDALNRLTDATVTDTVTLAQVAQTTTAYDDFGNITFKSDVGGYVYNGADGGPHAVTKAGGVDYVYDANGAMVSAIFTDTGAALRGFTWSSFNKPVRIEGAGGILASEFVYGPNRSRIRQTVFDGVVETNAITYVGGVFERHEAPAAPDELVHYIAAGGVVAIFTKVDDGSAATDRTRYPHKDHLGSIDLVTGETGAVAEARSFGPWGRARNTDWSAPGADIPMGETSRGFTGHEHLDAVGLIHMNGRVYDPVLGRMASADPIVQAPGNAQSYNRYSYVMNNPLSFTDPSGFGWLSGLVKAIGRLGTAIYKGLERLGSSAIGQAVLQIATIAWCGGTAVCAIAISGAFGGAQTAMAGGNIGDILGSAVQGAAFAGMAAGMSFAIGGAFEGTSGSFGKGMKTVAHGVSGGIQSKIRGGSFRSGFLAGSFASATSGIAGRFKTPEARIAAAAVAGGAGSVLGGGKFANGAVTGAFQRLFNDEITHVEYGEDDYPFGEKYQIQLKLEERMPKPAGGGWSAFWGWVQALGSRGENTAAFQHRRDGKEVYDGRIVIDTIEGIREPDLAIREPGQTRWEFVEVKTNTGTPTALQIKKDVAIETVGYVGLVGPPGILGRRGPTNVHLTRVIIEK